MRTRSAIGIGLTIAMVVSAPVPAHAVGNSHEQAEPASTTRADAVAAMHDEAYAYMAYRVYAAKADQAGLGTVAKLFRKNAEHDRYENFSQLARLTGLVRSDVDNLTDAITGEHYEATTMYPRFARQAKQDGCTAAADLFTEISHDEARHAQWYTAALDALVNPDHDQNFPTGDRVPGGAIPAESPRCTGQTLANLKDAMHGEALARLKYQLYAEHARQAGHPRLAQLFTDVSTQERNEHFAEEAALAGLVRSTKENLRSALTDAQDAATTTYPEYRDRAAQRGDVGAARLFNELAQNEAKQACRFTAALAEPFLGKAR